MSTKGKFVLVTLLVLWLVGILSVLSFGSNVAVLGPKGPIASQQRDLMVTATLLSLIVVIPVFALTFMIAWKYRVGSKKKAQYKPDWDGDRRIEAIWWGVPLVLIAILSTMIYSSSHSLEPSKAIASNQPPLKIQVIALQWKWLFIYPEQNIATLNYVQFPANRPVAFEITADAPMNSFWIPSLGGQIYAMEGMSTRLNLMADKPGEFRGSSANISGKGFAGMNFTAKASTQVEFDLWVNQAVKRSDRRLTIMSYHKLAKPSEDNPLIYYASVEAGLYNAVIMKFMRAPHARFMKGHGSH